MPASEGRVIELNEWIMNSMNETELGWPEKIDWILKLASMNEGSIKGLMNDWVDWIINNEIKD